MTTTFVYVDKDGVPHDGDPSMGEKWAERAILGLGSCRLTKETQKAYPLRLKNTLSGRAWT
eukprot:12087596-Heterocapsa_arctica.AAC.1